MKPTNFIHAARAKRQTEVIRSLEQTFTDFAYPVYLFGSFATGNFHGYSDIDLVILVTKQQAKQAYNEACDKLAGLKTPYDILTCQSMDELDNTIQSTLHPLNTPPQLANTRKYQQGMTLIEIMIALLIGAFLLGGVIQIFVNTKQTYRMQEGLSRMQENGRFAMDFLSRDIRMAGYWGCMIPADEDIIGTEGASGAPDSITIRAAFVRPATDACGTNVTKEATVACPQTADPTNIYADNTSIITYSINANSLRRSTNCVVSANADIVEGIEDMQILYGADTDTNGTPDYYVAAGTVGLDMAQVVSVRLSLLARTIEDNLAAQPVPYTFNGTNVVPGDGTHPDDRRLRRVFTSTIAIRNRLP